MEDIIQNYTENWSKYNLNREVIRFIGELASKPMDQIIMNVAVGHYLQIIEQNEAEGNLCTALNTPKQVGILNPNPVGRH